MLRGRPFGHIFEHLQEHHFTIKVARDTKARMWRKKHIGKDARLWTSRGMFLKCLVSMAFITNAEGFCRSSRFKISFNISLARTGSSVVRNAKTSQQTAWLPRTICICEQNRCTAMLAKPHAPWIEVVVFKKYCWVALLSLYLMISCLRCYDVLTSLLMLKIKHFWEQSRIAHPGKQMCISSCAAWLAASLY